MNKEELIENLGLLHDEPWNNLEQYFEIVADFILANFTPKEEYSETEETCKGCMGPCGNCEPKGEAEKVTAKECYLAMVEGDAASPLKRTEIGLLVKLAHEAAEAFNNYKPE